jgi:peptidoglycan/xylan/chitin deacetylase (PgdA/CDA1 family)
MKCIIRGLVVAVLAVPLALFPTTGPAAAIGTGQGHRNRCDQWMALTFDDGPSYYRTTTLRTLRSKHVPATFFDVGMRVAANPQFAAFEAGEGHLVLNHSWSHPHLPALTAEQVRSQVLRTQEALREAGAPMPFKLIRPPYGDVDDAVKAEFTSLGYQYVNWDVVAVDWDVATTSDEIRDTIVQAFRPGLVILMHDGPIDSAAGAADEVALPEIIDSARQSGYCFGLLDPVGKVTSARLCASNADIPEVSNPVPYLPLGPFSRGQLPPEPYVIVDPAGEL